MREGGLTKKAQRRKGRIFKLNKWSCLFCRMLLQHTHTHTHTHTHSPVAFVRNSSLYVPHCCCHTIRPLQTHTHLQTCCFHVSEWVRLISCSTLHQGTQPLCLRLTHYHCVITAATGGLFSGKKPLTFSLLQPTGTTSRSPAAPPPLATHFCQLHSSASSGGLM